jgi:CRISPR/Cas system CSM-associated protein Csm3 (group 7 of RAMP superfamily)
VHDSALTAPGKPGTTRALTRLTLPHVAIDRFTSGATDAKLYSHEVIAPPARLTLRIDLASHARPAPDWAWPLLWLAIRDLDLGLVGIGAATTRGTGTLRAVTKIGPHLRGWDTALQALRADYRGEDDT